MSRPHPYDAIFAAMADEAFASIREQGDVGSIADFARRPAASAFLDLLAPPADRPSDPGVIAGVAHLAYTLYRYWQDGRITRAVPRIDLGVANLDPAPATRNIAGAVYLQFPERWFWAQIAESAPHEPLDGVFVAPTGHDLALTAILGFRPERFGFSQLTALADASDFAAAAGMGRDPPFGPVMDGGDAAEVHSLVSEAELVHLAQLALGWGAE